jgi:D-tyrosyl-tRNA(Tyr) deacylase
MKAVAQRVTTATVTAEGEEVARIDRGLLVLLGVAREDTQREADYIAGKVAGLRVFDDEQGKLNCSVGDVDGAVLLVSQFTLYGDCRKGRRPSFTRAAVPEVARRLYEAVARGIRARGVRVETGRFQACMQVGLVNDGPVTLIIDTERP